MKWVVQLYLGLILLGWMSCDVNDSESKEAPLQTFIDVKYPKWSPDGNSILYSSYGLVAVSRDLKYWTDNIDSAGVWVMNSNGNGRKQVLDIPFSYADWSNDGSKLVYQVGGTIYSADFDGIRIDSSSIRQLTIEGLNRLPEWSPDGNYIFYSQVDCSENSISCGLWLLNLESNTFELVSNGAVRGTWSGTSEEIVFLKTYGSGGQTLGDKFYSYNVSTKETEVIYELEGESNHISLSPLENIMAFTHNIRGETPNIWKLNLDTEELTQITFDGAQMPDWSPDGKKIVYVRDGIWTMNSDGSDKVNIKPLPYMD